MMFIGCFYSSQAICTYVVLGIVVSWFVRGKKKEVEKPEKKNWFLVSLIATHIFSFAEELRELLHKNVDAFEINEVNPDSDFYQTIMKEKIKVA